MEAPLYGVLELPRTAPEEIGRFVCALRRWMAPFMQLEAVTDVAYEAAMVRPGRDDHNTVQKLFGLATEAATNAYDRGARAEGINHQTMLKFWGGSGKLDRVAGKAASMDAALRHGWKCDWDDESDSLGVLCFYAHKHGISVPWDNQPSLSPGDLMLYEKRVRR